MIIICQKKMVSFILRQRGLLFPVKQSEANLVFVCRPFYANKIFFITSYETESKV
jgi:hypothetical protein